MTIDLLKKYQQKLTNTAGRDMKAIIELSMRNCWPFLDTFRHVLKVLDPDISFYSIIDFGD